ncbi:MAG: hypothetical protein JW841_06200 [Deltaproteobacteria bacterium]|nr:hypothetical protein [Deltaproteobacteria bacterium]
MSNDPHNMSHSAIIRKVLEVNPAMQIGDKTPQEMSEYLKATIKAAKLSPKYTDKKFIAIFNGMLAELEENLKNDLQMLNARRAKIKEKHVQLTQEFRQAVIQYLVATNSDYLPQATRGVLQQHQDLLMQLNLSVAMLSRAVRAQDPTII